MRKKLFFKKNIMRMMGVVNCLALALAAHTANIACGWIIGQPEEPEEAKKFRKF